MGYLLNEEQQSIVDLARDFCEREVKPYCVQWDREGIFPLETYKKAMDLGLHCLEIPEEYGGSGLDYLTAAAVQEVVSYYDLGFNTSLGSTSLSLKPVLMFGTEEQKKYYADVVMSGKMGCFALTEASAGSDAAAIKTTAVRDGDDYILNGTKCFITNGSYADIGVFFALTDKEKGVKGISAFIVDCHAPGFSVVGHEDKMGIRASDTASLVLDHVRVPASNLLGKEGEGFKIAMKTLDLARPFAGVGAVGVAQRCVDECVKYMKERICFGKPIAKLQALQFMLADMEIAVETSRQMIVHSIELYEAGKPFSKEAAIAKCYAADCGMKVATDAVQILCGYGYSREYPVEKLFRDAKVVQIYEGSNQVQRVVIAGQLLR